MIASTSGEEGIFALAMDSDLLTHSVEVKRERGGVKVLPSDPQQEQFIRSKNLESVYPVL